MKGNHWFIAGIIVFLVLMFAEGIFVVEKDFL